MVRTTKNARGDSEKREGAPLFGKRDGFDRAMLWVVTMTMIASLTSSLAAVWQGHLSERTMVAANRAYVYFQAPVVDRKNRAAEKTVVNEIVMPIGNAGNSPAVMMKYNVGCFTKLDDLERFYKVGGDRDYSVGSKVEIKPDACTFDIKEGDKKPYSLVYAAGTATYYDAIDGTRKHVTEACFEVNFNTESVGADGLVALVAPCRKPANHNCTDGECRS